MSRSHVWYVPSIHGVLFVQEGPRGLEQGYTGGSEQRDKLEDIFFKLHPQNRNQGAKKTTVSLQYL